MKHKNRQNATLLKSALVSTIFSLLLNMGSAQSIPADSLYFGQTPPSSSPTLFAPVIFNKSNVTPYVITFSTDGTQVFYDNNSWPSRTIMYLEYKNGKWRGPVTASFANGKSAGEPSFSPDGKRIYYWMFPDASNQNNTDIYYSEKQDSLWGNPGGVLKSGNYEFHPCLVNDTSIYFTKGTGDISRCQYKNGTYQNSVTVLRDADYPDAYVAPDESYLIIRSKRAGGYGKTDLYISYNKVDGSWTNPKNLGNKINTAEDEREGDITPDGKYMTFDRGNNLYWVSAGFIDSLKHTNYTPYLKNKIKNQTDTVNSFFSLIVPDSTFFDDDGNSTLTYAATLNDGTPLPSWISFNPSTKTFSGTPTTAGSFTFQITATDAAKTSASATFTLKVIKSTTSIQQSFDQMIQVYPNPTTDKMTITFGTITYNSALLKIRDIDGRLILSNRFHNQSTSTIDLTGISKGIYFLNLTIDGKMINKKICLE
jgi:hypothetical protein